LEYFENNFTAEYLKVPAHIDPNLGDLVQREHPQNIGLGQEHKNLQDRTNFYYDAVKISVLCVILAFELWLM